MPDFSVLHSPDEKFSVLLHNRSGAWKIVDGLHSIDDLGGLTSGMDDNGPRRDYRVITIFLNNSCNLRCSYCRFHQVTHHGVEYGDRDLAAVVNAVRRLCQPGEQVDIHFQGGEPLLRVEDIDQICRALIAAPFDVRFRVTTNGTIATNAVLQILKEHRIAVTLSIDGLPELHDKHRKFANGRGSFERVLETMELLRERCIPFGVFCVVSKPEHMQEIHNYLVDALGLVSFVLAPLEIDGTGTAEDLDAYLGRFYGAQIALLEQNIDLYLRDGIEVREYLGELLLWGKVSRSFYSKGCGDTPRSSCGERMHSIERNGDVLPCQNSRIVQCEGQEYINACLERKRICEDCEIRKHCSTPVCFTRLNPSLVREFDAGGVSARTYIDVACSHLKKREMALFDLLYRRKQDVLKYLTR